MGSIKKTIYSILERPRITEKSALKQTINNSVVFRVHPDATKIEIRHAVEQIFGVKVEQVRTINYMGKIKRTGLKAGRQQSWKKAYVELAEGNQIDLIEGL